MDFDAEFVEGNMKKKESTGPAVNIGELIAKKMETIELLDLTHSSEEGDFDAEFVKRGYTMELRAPGPVANIGESIEKEMEMIELLVLKILTAQ